MTKTGNRNQSGSTTVPGTLWPYCVPYPDLDWTYFQYQCPTTEKGNKIEIYVSQDS